MYEFFFVCIFVLVSLSFLIFLLHENNQGKQIQNVFKSKNNKKNCLFLIAHPDDEAMFFTPSILSFLREGWEVYLVCFSRGSAGGNPYTRTIELFESTLSLGIKSANVKILENQELQDGLDTYWNTNLISSIIHQYVSSWNISICISFDMFGITGHINHIAISKGMKLFAKKYNTIPCFVLETVPSIIRTYISIFDILRTICLRKKYDNTILFTTLSYSAWYAMQKHTSQFHLLRKLFIIFSRYSHINLLQRL